MKIPGMLILLLFFLNNFLLAQSSGKPELEKLVEEANGFFLEAMELSPKESWKAKVLYEKAAAYYEKVILDGHIQNGKLFYNTGNAYFRAGDIGRAILNYLKARQYIPNDKNLLQNLAYARSLRQDKIEEKEEALLMKTIFFWHYDIPLIVRLIICSVCFVSIWIFAILKLFFRQRILSFFIMLSVLLTALFLGSLIIELGSKSGEKPGVVLGAEVIARKGGSDTYEKSFQEPLHAGTEFRLIEERRGWYNIELKDGRGCWIPAKEVGLVK